MSTQTITKDRTQLHNWIDNLPPRQLDLIYQLVEELVGEQQDETEYLLSSNKMKERLLAARESGEGIPIGAVREKLGI
ncbi:hypothetical protein MNBD_CHLOROFLEXI01-2197 [hydrothermal vent metagenome]|uniref:Addiction module component n=1 Tax=hydrothermal vent metagenome TaxID=652676 RepID=A0A3B0VWT9_9ZZZZ